MKNNDILDTKTSSLASNRQENENQNKKIKKKNKIITGLSIATGILALSTTALGIAFGIADSKAMDYHNKLENVYQSNLYSLIDSVNNLENKLSKTISANGSTYQRKTLLEASHNASEAEISIASLPLSQSDIQDTVKMVNQISGYTTTLADNLAKGGTLSEDEISTLTRVHESVVDLQNQLNEFARKMERGYSILDASLDIDTDSNGFSRAISSLKNNDIEYPTMIYDGPFSDSVVNSNIKGLKGDKISKEEAATKLEELYKNADVVIGSVLIPGAKAPKLLRKEHLKLMKKGSVIVDVAIDQGGCFETSHPTTHDDPIFTEEGIIHYCVANMPGAVARTSTMALTNSTTHYGVILANKGLEEACKTNNTILTGLNIYNGKCTFKGVSDAFGIEYTDPKVALGL